MAFLGAKVDFYISKGAYGSCWWKSRQSRSMLVNVQQLALQEEKKTLANFQDVNAPTTAASKPPR